jgi:rhamnogalacturonyl hydrolase YesR
MKKIIILAALLTAATANARDAFSGKMNRKDVAEVCDAVARWQIADHPQSKHNQLDWTNGALYRGVVEWAKMTGNGDYIDFVTGIGEKHNWQMWYRPYHADDICVGQAFIELYRVTQGKKTMIQPAMERAFWVASHPSAAPLDKRDPVGKSDRWSWCDALFMAPPVYAALYTMTGEEVYLDYMNSEFRACVDSLYDRDEQLFYRDCIRIPLREANGAKQFWGRGNGWVYGGLALVLENLPADYAGREYYSDLFLEMTESILRTQDKKGAWHSSMLDPESYPLPENSASAFFCYGLAWGINNGYLKGEEHTKALEKGWNSLVAGVHPDGKLGYVQPVGAAPKATGADATDVYGVGAMLLAGSEIFQLTGGVPAQLPLPAKTE